MVAALGLAPAIAAPVALLTLSTSAWLVLLCSWQHRRDGSIRLSGDPSASHNDTLNADIPIDVQGWERRVKIKKLTLGFVAFVPILSNSYLVYSLPNTITALWLAFWINLLALTAVWITQQRAGNHWKTTLAISVLCFSNLSEGIATAILTIQPTWKDEIFHSIIPTAASAVCCFLAMSTSRSPPAITRSPFTYATDGYKKDCRVSFEEEASLLSIIVFGWASQIMKIARLEGVARSPKTAADGSDPAAGPVKDTDLPHLRAVDRAYSAYRTWTRSAAKSRSADGGGGWSSSAREDSSLGSAPGIFAGRKLAWRVFVSNRGVIVLGVVAEALLAISRCLPAWATKHFLQHLETRNSSDELSSGVEVSATRRTAFWLLVLVACLMSRSLIQNLAYYNWNCLNHGRIRTQLNTVLFEKTLKRRDLPENAQEADALGTAPEANIMSLFTVETARVSAGPNRLAEFLVSHPIQIIFGSWLLYQALGYSGFVGLLVPFSLVPLTHYFVRQFGITQAELSKATDRRIAVTKEVLSSIRFIKFMAFEPAYEKRVLVAREVELKALRKNQNIGILINTLGVVGPALSLLVSFGCYTLLAGRTLLPSSAFSAALIMEQIRNCLDGVAASTFNIIQAGNSLKRIESYLTEQGVAEGPCPLDLPLSRSLERFAAGHPATPTSAVHLDRVSIAWPKREETQASSSHGTFSLSHVTADFHTGLNLVTGPTGSGKTLLILGMLREADITQGQIIISRSEASTQAIDAAIPDHEWIRPGCAYVPQSAWLRNGSIRENILFTLPYNADRYAATIEACGLQPDLAILEHGDQTQVGERGVILSGGQKARVCLARAIYSRADTLLLDDVLSAVDSHTAKWILDNALTGLLAAGRVLILVSHHVQLCAPRARSVMHLQGGGAAFVGTGDEYMTTVSYQQAIAVDGHEGHTGSSADSHSADTLLDEEEHNGEQSGETTPRTSMSEVKKSPISSSAPPAGIVTEIRSTGNIGRSVWMFWARGNGGLLFWISVALVFVSAKGSLLLRDYIIGLWTSHNAAIVRPSALDTKQYLALFAAVSAGILIPNAARFPVVYQGSRRLSRRIYADMLRAVLRSPMRFFDTGSLGILLNRFGRDVEAVDVELAKSAGSLATGISGFAMVLFTILLVSPYFAFLIGPLILVYAYYGWLYSLAARELRRNDAISKSPMYSLYNETISGVAVIRAFGLSSKFMIEALKRIDQSQLWYYLVWYNNRWLGVRFDMISTAIVAGTGLVLVTLPPSFATAGFAGFVISSAIRSSNEIIWLIRHITETEVSMVSVERCKEFTELQSEAAAIVEPRPAASWPHAGAISVDTLCVRYAPRLPRVLKNVTFDIRAGEKVGIVGATGSGKTTLSLAFFRFNEAESGSIMIDGVDVSGVGLHDLRSRLTIVPQEPSILSGTVRSTLDPLEDGYSDQEMYDALRRVHLLKTIDSVSTEETGEGDAGQHTPSFFSNLDSAISEQGRNLSAGERQLLCLARAILKRSKVVLLDEATSAVDYSTDRLVTQTIAEEFAGSTLLVIAHRLRTVAGFDRILVMHEGEVAEFDTPAKLLADPGSRFRALCKATGKREFRTLQKLCEARSEHYNAA